MIFVPSFLTLEVECTSIAMTTTELKIGVVVRDSRGQIGIVREPEPAPSKHWIDEQRDAAVIKALGPTQWWGVLPFDGGYVLSPEPLLEVLREATHEDFLAAVDAANVPARAHLAKMFPQYVDRILAERRK